MPETEIGRVSHFFSRVSVAGIDLARELSVGDTIRVQAVSGSDAAMNE